MQLLFKVELQDDTGMLFQGNNTRRRIVVTFELWVPKLQLSPAGQTLVNENFLKPTQWRYLQETLVPSTSRGDAGGQWQISPGVKNANTSLFSSNKHRNKTTRDSTLMPLTPSTSMATTQQNWPPATSTTGQTFTPNWIMKVTTKPESAAI